MKILVDALKEYAAAMVFFGKLVVAAHKLRK
jgi:hypothetical protein